MLGDVIPSFSFFFLEENDLEVSLSPNGLSPTGSFVAGPVHGVVIRFQRKRTA